MNPTSRVSVTARPAPQAGENSQTNGPEHTIVSSILTDLIFKRKIGRRAVSSDPPLTQRSSQVRATSFKILNWHKYYPQLQPKSWSWILRNWRQIEFLVSIESVDQNPCWKSMNQSASNSNIECTLARAKLLTNWSEYEPNNTIQLRNFHERNFHENQITKEIGISVAQAKPCIWPLPCYFSVLIHPESVPLRLDI
jgi:hypothetical protein